MAPKLGTQTGRSSSNTGLAPKFDEAKCWWLWGKETLWWQWHLEAIWSPPPDEIYTLLLGRKCCTEAHCSLIISLLPMFIQQRSLSITGNSRKEKAYQCQWKKKHGWINYLTSLQAVVRPNCVNRHGERLWPSTQKMSMPTPPGVECMLQGKKEGRGGRR